MHSRTTNELMLIPGLELGERLVGAGAFGVVHVVVDKRCSGIETKRVGRLLSPATASDLWIVEFSARLERLTGKSLLGVSLPLEVHSLPDGRFLLLVVRHQQNVDASLGAERGLGGDAKRFDRLADQLLVGLAELHGLGIAHGDIRPRNLFLDNNRTRSSQLWIVDAAIGPLAHWSGGLFQDPESHLYFPPEWGNRNAEPSPKADLYAAGLSLTEMILGREAIPGRGSHLDRENTAWKNIAPRLKEAGASWPLRRLIRILIADEAVRPANAVAAKSLFESYQAWPSRLRLGTVATISLLVGVIVAWLCVGVGYRSKLSRAQNDSIEDRSQLEGATKDLSQLRRQVEEIRQSRVDLAKLSEGFARIEKLLAAKSAPPSAEKTIPAKKTAKNHWKDYVTTSKEPAVWAAGLKKLEGFLAGAKEKDLDDANRNELNGFLAKAREILPVLADAQRMTDLKNQNELAAVAIQSPWDVGKTEKALDALALLAASRRWRAWSEDESLDEKTVDQRILLLQGSKPREYKLLQDWWDKLRSKEWWTVVLVSGKTTSDWGRSRRLSIESGYGWYYGDWHGWTGTDSKTFDYQTDPEQLPSPESLEFAWKPGKPLHLVLRSGSLVSRGGAGGNIIDHTIKGPFAPWRLHDERVIGKDGDVLELKVEFDAKDGFPGPPPIPLKGVLNSLVK